MNMKVRKSVIAFLMATTMVGSTAVPAMADTVTAKVSIKASSVSPYYSGDETVPVSHRISES